MRSITRRTVYSSRSDIIRLYVVSDVHLDNQHCEEKHFQELVDKIAEDPMGYWIGLGDYCDYINLRDPRFEIEELPPWLMNQALLRDIGRAETSRFLEIVEPIKDKCIALIEGNHEAAIARHSEADVYGAMIEAIQGKYPHRLDHRGFVNWQFQRQEGGTVWTLRLFATHGSGGGSSRGNAANKLGKAAEQVDGTDIILMGHLHDPDYKPIAKWRAGNKRASRPTIHAISAPALCSDMKYANDKDLPALPTGWVELEIEPNRKQVRVQIKVGG